MPERDYSHRTVFDKLGVKPGHRVAFADRSWPLDSVLRDGILARTGAHEMNRDLDLVFITADDATDVQFALDHWKRHIRPGGAIWVLTPKRGKPGYVNQTDLIPAGVAAGLVDNKVCSVSDLVSAMRFVIRRSDRPRH